MRVYELVWGVSISIHALLAESDEAEFFSIGQPVVFLSTLSLRRATNSLITLVLQIHYFYPRSPCGERHFLIISVPIDFYFYPRSPCGERQQKCTKQWGTFAHMKQILWGLHLHADRQGCILPFLPLFFPYFLVRRNREFYD